MTILNKLSVLLEASPYILYNGKHDPKRGQKMIFYRGSGGKPLHPSTEDAAIFFTPVEHIAKGYGPIVKSYYLKAKHPFDNYSPVAPIIAAAKTLVNKNPDVKWYKKFLKQVLTLNKKRIGDANHTMMTNLGSEFGSEKVGEVMNAAGYDSIEYIEDATYGIFHPSQAVEIHKSKNESFEDYRKNLWGQPVKTAPAMRKFSHDRYIDVNKDWK
jgi:hypothetical protein